MQDESFVSSQCSQLVVAVSVDATSKLHYDYLKPDLHWKQYLGLQLAKMNI